MIKKRIVTIILATTVLCATIAGGVYVYNALNDIDGEGKVTHQLRDENAQRLQTITSVDEEGNIQEENSESDGDMSEYENSPYSLRTVSTAQVVNFRTKGNATTSYTEEDTGTSGYTNGAYGADAAYLGMSGSKVRFMLAGVVGLVNASEVQLVNVSDARSISCYEVSGGRLYHRISQNISTPGHATSLDNGSAPSYLSSGTTYYSYDGHYFYTSYEVMIADYQSRSRSKSVNAKDPFVNYYQYLPLRSQSAYSTGEVDNLINGRTSSDSKMRGLGNALVSYQNTYGVNAMIMAGIAANESAWGTSNISKTKNNLFGLNAVDSSPGTSASTYASTTECVRQFACNWMSMQYLSPKNWKYNGAFLGDKASGMNVQYASDPYWGEKAASLILKLDGDGGSRDYGRYTIGIKGMMSTSHSNVNVRSESNTSSSVLYQTGTGAFYSTIILNPTKQNGFYQIQSDGVLNSSRTGIDTSTGNYNFANMYSYISGDYVSVVNSGTVGWTANAIKTNMSSPQCRNTEIQLTADIIGNTSGLQYKFVWQKDNWAEWGVVQNYSSSPSATWQPLIGGDYTLYMDVMDASGKAESVTLSFEVENWEITSITPNLPSPQVKNTAIDFTVNTAGDNAGLYYKAVWEKDNWAKWGVIRNYSTNPEFSWTPTEAGTYTLYIDVMTSSGRTVSQTLSYTVLQKGWNITDIDFSEKSPQQLDTPITVGPVLKSTLDGTVLGTDHTQGYLYKYIWEKDNWAQWGVLSDYTEAPNWQWQPQVDGDYNFYIDVMDPEGNAESYHSSYKITEGVWKYEGIESDPLNTNVQKSDVKLTTKISGNAAALQYKYVWNKNNWAQWGVIQPYDTDPNVVWNPEETGTYTVTVDIMRSNGKTESHSTNITITDKAWKCTGITTGNASPQELGFTTSVTAQIQNAISDLQYKYVWEKNNWAEWGVLKPFSSDATVNWTPESAGDYTLYVDVMDSDGNAESKTTKYTVDEGKWTYNQITFNPDSSVIGENIAVQADITGNTLGLRYKYVWEKDNWAQWGVIRDFDSDQSVDWKPTQPGTYTIYLDILSSSGKMESKTVKHTINDKSWNCTGISSSLESPQKVGITTSLKAQITNPTDDLVYKYVWEKNNWAEWGVLQPFSTESTVDWTPDTLGEYTIYVDVMDRYGNAESRIINYSIR